VKSSVALIVFGVVTLSGSLHAQIPARGTAQASATPANLSQVMREFFTRHRM
jgi:hypothetical protein